MFLEVVVGWGTVGGWISAIGWGNAEIRDITQVWVTCAGGRFCSDVVLMLLRLRALGAASSGRQGKGIHNRVG